MQHYDVIIIGAGQAGGPLSKALAEAGRKVALIESTHLGGSCVNYGCTPTKAAVASARIAHLARRGSDYGINIGHVQPDFKAVLDRAKKIVAESRDFLQKNFAEHANPKLIQGYARLAGREGERFRISIGDQQLTAAEVVLNTGTRSVMPDIDGLDEIDAIDAENWLEHDMLPKHVVMVGGGYIGLEMGQFYRRMGAEVTIIDSDAQIAAHEDKDVADTLQKLLEAEGIAFQLDTQAARFRKHAGGVTVTVTQKKTGASKQIDASHVFMAVGRRPNTDDLGLDTIDLRPTEKGAIEVDKHLRTSVRGIWAVGDIRGGPMFTHTSWDDFRTVKSLMLGDGSHTADRVVPYAMFTDPELGRVGMTESEARRAGKNITVARFAMKHNGKAREIGETNGFIKVVVDADTRRILGAAVLSAEAAELVHTYIAFMNADAPYTVLENAIQIHPTLAEAIQSAVSALGK